MTPLEQIAAIIDAAGPAERPEIPARAGAPKDKTGGRRQAGAPNNPSAAPTHAAGADSNPPDPPDTTNILPFPAGRPAAASPPAADLSAQSASSQTGGSSKSTADEQGDGARELGARRSRRGKGQGGTDELDLRLSFFPHTDLGNAERFVERNRGKFLWCPALGWLFWDEKRWCRDGADDRVRIAAHQTVRAMQDEAEALAKSAYNAVARVVNQGKPNEKTLLMSDLLSAWGRESESNGKLNRLAEQASAYLAIAPAQLDADLFKLNVANGTLVVSRERAEGEDYITLRPHDPADLITKISPVVYDQAATCPIYDAFIAFVQPNADNRRFLHQWKGLSLTGDVGEQKLAVFWGRGKNGKSTFIDVCAFIAGDYSETVPIETFLSEGRGRNAGQATPDLAILPGVRHLRTSEPDKGAKLAEALIKLATGGEPIQARHLNRDYFKFYPQFKLTISGNYRPNIGGSDEGIWRRVVLVPWGVIVPEEKRDKNLGEKLRREASGIFNRLLDGLRDWLDRGLIVPDEVAAATAEYRRDSDPLGRFLEACVAPAPGERVQSSELHKLFNAWGKCNGNPEWSNKGFTSAMTERGFRKMKSSVEYFLEIKTLRVVDDFLDHEGKPRRQAAAGDVAQSDGGGKDDDVVF